MELHHLGTSVRKPAPRVAEADSEDYHRAWVLLRRRARAEADATATALACGATLQVVVGRVPNRVSGLTSVRLHTGPAPVPSSMHGVQRLGSVAMCSLPQFYGRPLPASLTWLTRFLMGSQG